MDALSSILQITTILYAVVALCFFFGLYCLPSFPPPDTLPFISVVIAARDEADFIGNCLSGLGQQTYPSDKFEVIVVDDLSTDNTHQIAKTFAQTHPNVHLLSVGDSFSHMAAKKRPLSVGIHHARGEWIVTTDADCEVPPTWLSGLATYMHQDAGVVIGFSQIKTANTPLKPFERLQAFDFLSLMTAAAGAVGLRFPLAATGQNFAYRKNLFERIGGFKKINHRPSGDDVLLLQLLRRAWPRTIAFANTPDTFVSTYRPETIRSFWHQRRRWASNAGYQIRLNPAFFVYMMIVFGLNALLLFNVAIGTLSVALTCWLIKAVADLLVAYKGCRIFGRIDLLQAWPVWELLHPFYITFVGLIGTLGGFTWKNRHHP